MKFIFIIISLFFILLSTSCEEVGPSPRQESSYWVDMEVDGITRRFFVHLPPSYLNSSATYPLVIAFHDVDETVEEFYNYSQLNAYASGRRYVMIYPEALPQAQSPLRGWNAGKCCNTGDDMAFMQLLMDFIQQNLRVKKDRIYALGNGNGGMFVYRLACEFNDPFTAFAVHAGTIALETPCQITQPVSLIHFHAVDNERLPASGGVSSFYQNKNFISADSSVAVFAASQGCQNTPDTLFKSKEYAAVQWKGCQKNQETRYFKLFRGNHSWPGGRKKQHPNAPEPNFALDLNDTMWEFFKAFVRIRG